MLFIIVAILTAIVLRLQTRWRFKTIVWVSIVFGLIVDFSGDLLVMLRR
jgi:hypothetical protein